MVLVAAVAVLSALGLWWFLRDDGANGGVDVPGGRPSALVPPAESVAAPASPRIAPHAFDPALERPDEPAASRAACNRSPTATGSS